MPTIITAPTRSRHDSRGVTENEMNEYIEAMNQAGKGEIVIVDDSASDNYEKSYARGERLRQAMLKANLIGKGEVEVRGIKMNDDPAGEYFVCSMAWKA